MKVKYDKVIKSENKVRQSEIKWVKVKVKWDKVSKSENKVR